jgi:hypothetical protein
MRLGRPADGFIGLILSSRYYRKRFIYFFKVVNIFLTKFKSTVLDGITFTRRVTGWAWRAGVQLHPSISHPLGHFHLGTPASPAPLGHCNP